MRTAVVMSLLAVLSCGGAVTGPEELVPGSADAGTLYSEAPDATPIGTVLPPEICGNGLDDNGNGYIDEGCSCKVNATQACWPGDPKMRHVGRCKDGVQTCSADDVEFPKWGACVGAVTDCDDPQCQDTAFCACTAETCQPGTTRWCDGPQYCDWGQETCGPDHKWGACREVNQHPAGCDPFLYNEVCCENAGGCCEGIVDHMSYGNCPGVVKTCYSS